MQLNDMIKNTNHTVEQVKYATDIEKKVFNKFTPKLVGFISLLLSFVLFSYLSSHFSFFDFSEKNGLEKPFQVMFNIYVFFLLIFSAVSISMLSFLISTMYLIRKEYTKKYKGMFPSYIKNSVNVVESKKYDGLFFSLKRDGTILINKGPYKLAKNGFYAKIDTFDRDICSIYVGKKKNGSIITHHEIDTTNKVIIKIKDFNDFESIVEQWENEREENNLN